MLRYKILEHLPPYGPLPEQFTYGPRMYREGFVVEFYPENGEKWIANFQIGMDGISTVTEHPNGKYIFIIANGQGYTIDLDTRSFIYDVGWGIKYIFEIPEIQQIVFEDEWGFTAFGPEGKRWRTREYAIEGLRAVQRKGNIATGETESPDGTSWVSFSVDLINGDVKGGAV
jgi:hypothetical protein